MSISLNEPVPADASKESPVNREEDLLQQLTKFSWGAVKLRCATQLGATESLLDSIRDSGLASRKKARTEEVPVEDWSICSRVTREVELLSILLEVLEEQRHTHEAECDKLIRDITTVRAAAEEVHKTLLHALT